MAGVIAYLGPEGTYCEQAARLYLHTLPAGSAVLHPLPTIAHILSAVDKGELRWGVVPAENSIEGSVNITLDMLAHELDLFIQKEIILKINHCLLSHMSSLEEVHTVMSHPHALAQCRLFLQREMPKVKLVETSSTAGAVLSLATGEKGLAAIASPQSHHIYKVPILVSDIGDFANNQTRFLAVGKEPALQNAKKTSLILSLKKDRPGGLYEILGQFAQENINLTKIESRPTKKELGNYLFFIDCQAGQDQPSLKRVLQNLHKNTAMLKILGSYTTLWG